MVKGNDLMKRVPLIAGGVAAAVLALASIAATQARAVERKADGIQPGMTVREVLQQLDGWSMINTHPVGSRAIPDGTGPEFNGYSGALYVRTPVRPDGRETDRRKISRAEFEGRLETMLSAGTPWSVYFNFRAVPTDTGILVRFDGNGRVARHQ